MGLEIEGDLYTVYRCGLKETDLHACMHVICETVIVQDKHVCLRTQLYIKLCKGWRL